MGYVIESSKLLSHLIRFAPKIRSNKNPESLLCDDNAKNIKLAHPSFFMLIVTGLLNLLFPIYLFFYLLFDLLFFVRNAD